MAVHSENTGIGDEFLQMPEYPVYNWRGALKLAEFHPNNDIFNEEIKEEYVQADLFSQPVEDPYMITTENALATVKNLFTGKKLHISTPQKMLLPGFGAFQPHKVSQNETEMNVLFMAQGATEFESKKPALQSYISYLSAENKMLKIRGFLVDIGNGKVEVLSV